MKRESSRKVISQTAADHLYREARNIMEKEQEVSPSPMHRDRMDALFHENSASADARRKAHKGIAVVAACATVCAALCISAAGGYFTGERGGTSNPSVSEYEYKSIYVPAGYSLRENVETSDGTRLVYQNEAGEQLKIEWMDSSDLSGEESSGCVESENTVIREENGVTVKVVAALSRKELDKISQSVQIP